MLPLIMTAASVAMQAGSAIAGHAASSRAAAATNAHNAQVESLQRQHRDEVMRWQNETWEQDIKFARDTLDWSRDEFQRQGEWVGKAQQAATENRNAQAFTLMLRSVEEAIGFTLGDTSARKQGRQAQASFAARDRGVEGNSFDAVMADVDREVGERRAVMDMNRSAVNRQLFRESLALDAEADQQLSQLASSLKTYSPSAPIRTPQPLDPIQPARRVEGPSGMALAMGLGNAVAGGFNTFTNLSGQDASKTLGDLSAWASRTLRL